MTPRCCNSCQALKNAYNDKARLLKLSSSGLGRRCLSRSLFGFLHPVIGLAGQGLPYFHVLDTAMQCKSSIGCRIKGKVVVNKASCQRTSPSASTQTSAPLMQVSGNIHVALGKSVRRDGKLVHEFNIEDIGDSVTHKFQSWRA